MNIKKLKKLGFNPNKDYCSFVPDKWLNVKINDICFLHDKGYEKGGNLSMKLWVDLIFGLRICWRGIWRALQALCLNIVGVGYFFGVLIGGWKGWNWGKK